MKYSFVKKGDIVFDIGTIGDKFYIILNGLVSILVPKKVDETAKENEEKNEGEGEVDDQFDF